jgi:radical SAM protein with 4Fe4S-binding SPASM domain
VSRFDELRERAARACIPLSAHFELTARCNARCVHCFQGPVHARAPRELSAAEWCAAVDQARALGTLTITLSGGEAMLSPHFWAVAEHVRRVGLAFRVFTNGIALSREAVHRLAALRPLSVEVSVFSLSPARHDAVTGVPGSLSRALRGLFRLRRAGVPLAVKCPLLAGNVEDHGPVRRLAERLGASAVFDPQIAPALDGGCGPMSCRGEDRELVTYFADPATQAYDPPRSAPIASDRATCGMGRTLLMVSSEGDVLPCTLLRRPAGNLRRATLAEVWRSPAMEQLRARRFGALDVCGTCPRSGYCGRCSAIALLEDGNLDGPSKRACHMAELRERAWGNAAPAESASGDRSR